jgi:DNA-binding NarL/FixJ family response regulator
MAIQAVDPDIQIKVAGCLTDALAALRTGTPRIITLDLSLPDCNGFAGLLQIRIVAKDAPVVIVSGHDRPSIIARVEHIGAAGFVSKCEPIAIHIAAFRAVLSGKCWFPDMAFHDDGKGKDKRDRLADLTPAQHRVLEAMGDGTARNQ